MSIRTTLSNSVLARFLWGEDPPSRRRRLRERFLLWLPATAFVVTWISIFATFTRPTYEEFVISAMLAHVIASLVIIAARVAYSGGPQELRQNWADYYLAGFTSHETLAAYSYNALRGGIVVAALALAAVGLFSLPEISDWYDQGAYWLCVCAQFDAAFMLTGGILLDTALWTTAPSRSARLLTVGWTLLLSPAVLGVGALLIDQYGGVNIDEDILSYFAIPLTVFTLGIRIWMVRRQWRMAVQRLEDGLIEPALD